jgi:hypothetical protein
MLGIMYCKLNDRGREILFIYRASSDQPTLCQTAKFRAVFKFHAIRNLANLEHGFWNR